MTKAKYLPFPVFILITLVLGFGVWYTVKQSMPVAEPIGINEIVATGSVSLEASPPPTYKSLKQAFTIDINEITAIDRVTAVQLELNYDPTKLNITGYAPTPYFPNFLANPIYGSGKFTVSVGVPTDSGGNLGFANVGKITIVPLALGEHTVFFGPSTQVSAIDSTTNVLKSAYSFIVTVFNVGDINKDKKVNIFDYSLFVKDYGITGYSSSDLNRDGKVNIFDYSLFVADYGKIQP
jgi:hypothetical protein